ncbi:MAG: ATP-binding cassette domain-containing protein [candidate division Zixibacteria bacterium]|nr:ATP-binding cassette domain-containing protein [candidate division Zixibacteria bacterium]
MKYFLEVVNLTKRFGGVTAVDDLSFAVAPGDVFGFLGRNGAGKTTTIKVALDLVKPTGGEVRLFGDDWREPELRRRVGYLPEFPVRYPNLTPRRYLRFAGRLFGLARAQAARRADELIAQVELDDAADRRLGGFSKGMLQRTGLAQALVNEPDLLFLDEPTAGLDPLGHHLVKELVRDYAARGKAVVVSSHILAEIEAQCSRVAIIDEGRLVAEGELAELLKPTNVVEVELDGPAAAAREAFGKISSAVDVIGKRFVLTLLPGKEASDVSRAAAAAACVVTALTTRRRSLEDLFVSVVRSSGEDAPA